MDRAETIAVTMLLMPVLAMVAWAALVASVALISNALKVLRELFGLLIVLSMSLFFRLALLMWWILEKMYPEAMEAEMSRIERTVSAWSAMWQRKR